MITIKDSRFCGLEVGDTFLSMTGDLFLVVGEIGDYALVNISKYRLCDRFEDLSYIEDNYVGYTKVNLEIELECV